MPKIIRLLDHNSMLAAQERVTLTSSYVYTISRAIKGSRLVRAAPAVCGAVIMQPLQPFDLGYFLFVVLICILIGFCCCMLLVYYLSVIVCFPIMQDNIC